MSKLSLIFSILIVIFYTAIFGAFKVSASTIPSFPNCVNPQGSQVAYYLDGTHGIVGNSVAQVGSDAVYQVAPDADTQCFCDINGNGIQTNWWRVDDMSFDEIQTFEQQGWTYIPNGQKWGLSEDPYLASNANFSCQGNGGGGSSSTSSSSAGVGGGNILASSIGPTILGLANTGNLVAILIWMIMGILALLAGLSLRRKISK